VKNESAGDETSQVRIEIDPELFDRAKRGAASSGYSDVEKFIANCIERELQRLKIEKEEGGVRYRLLTVGTVNGVEKALVEDLAKRTSRLMAVGEKIGDVTLIKIMREESAIRLKGTAGHEFTVGRAPAK
jgi:hypothetical protein